MNPERYHLTLTIDGKPTQHGWWGSEATAHRKFTEWIGEHDHGAASVTLADEATASTLDTWPVAS